MAHYYYMHDTHYDYHVIRAQRTASVAARHHVRKRDTRQKFFSAVAFRQYSALVVVWFCAFCRLLTSIHVSLPHQFSRAGECRVCVCVCHTIFHNKYRTHNNNGNFRASCCVHWTYTIYEKRTLFPHRNGMANALSESIRIAV